VNWADLMAAQGAFGTDFYDRSILRPKHRGYYRSGRPVIKICPKGAQGCHEIRPIHSAPSLEYNLETIKLATGKKLKGVPYTRKDVVRQNQQFLKSARVDLLLVVLCISISFELEVEC